MPLDWEWIDLGDTELVDTLATEWTKGVFVLDAAGGSYAITGTAASFVIGYAVIAGAGTLTISGTAALLIHRRKVGADSGTYTITGTAAELTSGQFPWHWTDIDSTEYVDTLNTEWTKKPLTAADYTLACEAGSSVITGTAASFVYNRHIDADGGAYTIAGADATLWHGYKIPAEASSYSLTGTAATLLYHHAINVDAGSYALTGTAVDLLLYRLVGAEAGTYAITGQVAELTYSGAVAVPARRRGLLMGVY